MITVRNPELFKKYFEPTYNRWENCIVEYQPNGYKIVCEEHKEPWQRVRELCKGLSLIDWYLCNRNYGSWVLYRKIIDGR